MKTNWSGEKIAVSYVRPEDLEDICKMLAKETVCRWLFFGPNTPEATTAYFTPLIESVSAALYEGRIPESPVFTISSKKNREFAGQCAILPVEFSPGSYLIGYQIDDKYHGKGFGTEACEFLVYYAFTFTDAYRLNGDTAEGNTASRKIMERCGFEFEGRRKKYWHAHGDYYDQLLYGLLKEALDESFQEYLRLKWG
ncbi:GCN5-related N-acetyltransferase [Methanolacinia petrolearia DSM 11571]|uniref:GCN5-related N-acetyltransferase n=1 Tax=Methanolacinia petrolearia (strain DSM 11571 / OCM 486 / SEBR 4847) TaxID=679926 RepID=E1RHK9_METP4|nr:GNAT family protein [Methanolacinia petrolearia]ADN35318.1 GCN5-related N-acetyltransferase [Methanolacinia petrolearia DSM 11571]